MLSIKEGLEGFGLSWNHINTAIGLMLLCERETCSELDAAGQCGVKPETEKWKWT